MKNIIKFEVYDAINDITPIEMYLVNPNMEKLNAFKRLVDNRYEKGEQLCTKYKVENVEDIPIDKLNEEEKIIVGLNDVWYDEVLKYIKKNFETINIKIVMANI